MGAAVAPGGGRAGAPQPWTIVTGQHAPDSLHAEIAAAAPRHPGLELLRTAPDLPARIACARLSISRGGYNTMAETVAAGTRGLIVPFAPPGEPEQRLRAERFAALGLVTHLPEADLAGLPDAMTAARAAPPPNPGAIQTGGAAASAARLAEIAGRG